MRETFVVSFEVEVDGAEGGWNQQPIMDAVRDCVTGPTPESFRLMTVERKTAAA